MNKCVICGKPIPDGGKYACVWDLPKVGFAHLECVEGYEDVTEEVTGHQSHED